MAAMIREAEQVCHPCFDDNRGYHQVQLIVGRNCTFCWWHASEQL